MSRAYFEGTVPLCNSWKQKRHRTVALCQVHPHTWLSQIPAAGGLFEFWEGTIRQCNTGGLNRCPPFGVAAGVPPLSCRR